MTAGPTHEPLDLVRRLTNFSTGRLGTNLAEHLVARGFPVTLFRGESASAPPPSPTVHTETFSCAIDLASRFLQAATDEPVAVFHAAAVSDFTVGLAYHRGEDRSMRAVYSSKLSTRGGPFLVELRPTPKILTHLRDWYPNGWIIGWKFETEGDRDSALGRGREQLAEARTDGCVVNGPAHGPGFTFISKDGLTEQVADEDALYRLLVRGIPSRQHLPAG